MEKFLKTTIKVRGYSLIKKCQLFICNSIIFNLQQKARAARVGQNIDETAFFQCLLYYLKKNCESSADLVYYQPAIAIKNLCSPGMHILTGNGDVPHREWRCVSPEMKVCLTGNGDMLHLKRVNFYNVWQWQRIQT